MSKQVYVVDKRRNDGWWTILAAALIIVFIKELLLVACIAASCWAIYMMIRSHREAKAARMLDEAIISKRADYENMLAIQGDPAGVYGQYDAYTMPVTKPYGDYDDGLRSWI
jgi:hypothetical protein